MWKGRTVTAGQSGCCNILGLGNSYNMATRALADLSPEGAKRPRAINQSSARGAML